MRLATLGPRNPATTRSLHRVGVAYYFLDDLDRATTHFLRAIEVWQAQLPGSELPLADSLTMQAFTLLRWGRFEPALKDALAALELRRSVLPPDHNLIGEGLNNAAKCLFELGRIDEAIEYLLNALAIDQASFTSDHNDLVLDYVPLALYQLAAGRLDEAILAADTAVAMATRLHHSSPNQGLLDRARQVKVEVLRAEGRLQQALDLEQEVLRTRRASLPASHPYVVGSQSVLADLLRQLGREEEAMQQFSVALDGWHQQPDRYTRQLVDSMQRFADAGHCEWLDTPAPSTMPAVMTAALERSRAICSERP
jgi:tetratricopeptide (TPR) repeat protein